MRSIQFAIVTTLSGALLLASPAMRDAHAQTKKTTGLAAPSSTAANSPQKKIADSIIVVVNNEVITRQELNERVRIVERRLSAQGAAMPPRAQLEKQLLERMILERLQLQQAKELNIRVDDQMLDRALTRIAEQNKLSLLEFRAQVERDGMSFPRFREEIREDILMQRVREHEVDSKVRISEAEVTSQLASENAQQEAQQEINLAQIMIRIPDNANAAQLAKSEKRAQEALQQIKSGKDFAQVAANYSDADTATSGGEIGWRTQDRLPQLFIDAIAHLKTDEISAIIKSPNGFHILKVIGKRSPSVVKLDNGSVNTATTQTHARHILIKVNQLMSSADALRKASELKQKLDKRSASFEELAKAYSNDGSAAKGGDLGWIYPGDTVPEFERAMNALQPGQVSNPIESPFGYHLIEVLERKNGAVPPERRRLIARQALQERKTEEALQEWLRQLRDRAYVEYRMGNE